MCSSVSLFPSPLEVDRGLYVFGAEEAKNFYYVFPAPREVDRYLYPSSRNTIGRSKKVAGPSRGR